VASNGEVLQSTPSVEALLVQQPTSTTEFFQEPQQVLERAEKVAKALKGFLDRKADKVVFKGKRYPQAEDWQFVAAFFGHTARVRSTEEVIGENDLVEGYIAIAEVVDASGRVVSAAEAACTRDEDNWAHKPDFQLRSMAQTRACAKSLRNVFAWVMILAGLAPTPAEEMVEENAQPAVQAPQRKSAKSVESEFISEPQQKRLFAIAKEHNVSKDQVREILGEFGFEFSREITKRAYAAIIRRIEQAA
jgi:hypothetical protein